MEGIHLDNQILFTKIGMLTVENDVLREQNRALSDRVIELQQVVEELEGPDDDDELEDGDGASIHNFRTDDERPRQVDSSGESAEDKGDESTSGILDTGTQSAT